MPRVRKGSARARKHRKILKAARGHIGAGSRRYRVAREARLRAGQHAVIGRKLRKRDFRRLWITRISAACRMRGVSYSRFMHGLAEKGMVVNRKMLADIAVADPGAFDRILAEAMADKPAAAPEKPAKVVPPKAAAEKPPEAEAPPEEPAEEAPAEKPKPAAKKPTVKKKTVKKAAVKKTTVKKAAVKKTTVKKAAAKKPAAKKKTARKPAGKKPKGDAED